MTVRIYTHVSAKAQQGMLRLWKTRDIYRYPGSDPNSATIITVPKGSGGLGHRARR